MHVAIDGSFLDLPPSGTATYTAELAAALATLPGVAVSLLRPSWSGTDPSWPATARHSRRDGARQVATLPASDETEGAKRIADLRGTDGPMACFGADRRLRQLAWELVGLARVGRAVRPDVLHVPHLSAPVRPGLPFVVTVHDVIPFVLPAYRASRAQRLRLAIVGRTVRAARLVLTPSRAAAADVERVLGIPGERIRVTPEAAGPEYRAADPRGPEVVAVARRFGIRDRYVFNVGGMDVRKNLPALVEGFARALPRLREPAQLVVAGAPHTANPAVYPPLAPLIDRLGLTGRVVLTGFVSPAEKVALYQGAELYVTPSLHEGFGLTPLEAMACGVPVVAANRASLPEVVGDAGLLVEPEPEPLAAALVALLDDPARRAELRARGLARAAEFGWERTARLTLAAYEEALGSPPPPTPLPRIGRAPSGRAAG